LAVCIIATIWPPEHQLQTLLAEVEEGQRERFARRPCFVRFAMFSMCFVVTEHPFPNRKLLPKRPSISRILFSLRPDGILARHTSNFNCQAGKSAFAINSSGEMNACLNLSKPAARPLDTGFRAAWEGLQHFVDDAPPLGSLCRACDMRGYCPRCPAWSAMETGTLTEPVPYLCSIARVRKERYEGMRP
jgi:radical SAM protein with 4Fe4S-binding SPASM domain